MIDKQFQIKSFHLNDLFNLPRLQWPAQGLSNKRWISWKEIACRVIVKSDFGNPCIIYLVELVAVRIGRPFLSLGLLKYISSLKKCCQNRPHIAFPFFKTPKIYLFFERCCQNCPHLMRSSFVGAAKKEVYYFWRYFALVYEIDRCIFRNLYLFGVTWHWYRSASLSLSAFLCYRLSIKISSNWQKEWWIRQSKEQKNDNQ